MVENPKTIKMITISPEHRAAMKEADVPLSKHVCQMWREYGPDLTAKGDEPFFKRTARHPPGVYGRFRTTIYVDADVDKSIKKYRVEHPKFNFSAWVDWLIEGGFGPDKVRMAE
jgi:hypothetical protein